MRASLLLPSPPPSLSRAHPPHEPPHLKILTSSLIPSFSSSSRGCSPPLPLALATAIPRRRRRRNDFRVWSQEGGGDEDAEIVVFEDEEEAEEEEDQHGMDFEQVVDHDGSGGGSDETVAVQTKSFMSTVGEKAEVVVSYRINEDEFHKISLLDCDFFIRRMPDPDGDVYDFSEMYVTPPDRDVYSIPKVLAPMPQEYIRCSKSDYGCWDVTEPDIDAPRDPLYVSVKEIHKVFLIKHYKNRRLKDPDFFSDFEEIYVIDSQTKSITRAKVVVTVPEGRNRDRKRDLLTVRDNGTSFKIIDMSQRERPEPIIERQEWIESREELEKHLRKLRDFSRSNWF